MPRKRLGMAQVGGGTRMKCPQCQAELVPSGCGCSNPKCQNHVGKWPRIGTMYSPPKKDDFKKKSKKKESE